MSIYIGFVIRHGMRSVWLHVNCVCAFCSTCDHLCGVFFFFSVCLFRFYYCNGLLFIFHSIRAYIKIGIKSFNRFVFCISVSLLLTRIDLRVAVRSVAATDTVATML